MKTFIHLCENYIFVCLIGRLSSKTGRKLYILMTPFQTDLKSSLLWFEVNYSHVILWLFLHTYCILRFDQFPWFPSFACTSAASALVTSGTTSRATPDQLLRIQSGCVKPSWSASSVRWLSLTFYSQSRSTLIVQVAHAHL